MWIKHSAKIPSWFFVFIFVAFSALAPRAQAEDATSTNFTLRAPVLDTWGSTATSTNFESTNAGGQIATGEATSTNFILRSGFLYFDEFTPKSQNWRWYNDETNETPVTPLSAENVAPTNIVNGNIIKLRLTLKEIADIGGKDIKYKIQFSESSTFGSGVNDAVATTTCAGASLWCYGDGVDNDNDLVTTRVLSDSNATGTHNEAGTSASTFNHKKSDATEFEFTLKHAGARANTTYFFRVFDVTNNKAVTLNTGKTFPSLSTQGATLTFTIGGLATSTVTEGITTDFATTATSIPFLTLGFNATTTGAQRLTTSTNATEGYQIFMFERQGFLHSAYAGVEINRVSGTNGSPSAWLTGCAGSASGCYGYHAGDDSLAGGSTRFSPNDTYAQATSTAQEVAFSSIPVTSGESIDTVFRAKITSQQEAGNYTSTIVYIVVPTF